MGGLAECCKTSNNRETLRKSGGIPPLIQLLNWTNQPLLENVASVLGECANDEESMDIIEELDGVRLVWSLLKNSSPRVQANAAWALCPMIHNAKVNYHQSNKMNIGKPFTYLLGKYYISPRRFSEVTPILPYYLLTYYITLSEAV